MRSTLRGRDAALTAKGAHVREAEGAGDLLKAKTCRTGLTEAEPGQDEASKGYPHGLDIAGKLCETVCGTLRQVRCKQAPSHRLIKPATLLVEESAQQVSDAL